MRAHRAKNNIWGLAETTVQAKDIYIEGQNVHAGSVHILDRVRPVWDDHIADMLNTKLRQGGIRSGAFEEILRVLIERGDGSALPFATNLVTTIPAYEDVDPGRPVAAAIQLLSRDVITNWPLVWRAIESNGRFASDLFARLARDPYNPATTHLLKHLREGQLADVYIWLIGNGAEPMMGSGIITPEKALGWLSVNLLNELAERGTAVAYREIRRIHAILPDLRLEFVSKSTEDLVRRNTWRPLPPDEFLSLVLDGPAGLQIAGKSQADAAGGSKTNKGNMALLQAGGELKRAVTLETARRFGGVTRRAIEDAAKKGDLLTEGKRTHRRVLVSSLLEYFPPEK